MHLSLGICRICALSCCRVLRYHEPRKGNAKPLNNSLSYFALLSVQQAVVATPSQIRSRRQMLNVPLGGGSLHISNSAWKVLTRAVWGRVKYRSSTVVAIRTALVGQRARLLQFSKRHGETTCRKPCCSYNFLYIHPTCSPPYARRTTCRSLPLRAALPVSNFCVASSKTP